jgi:hypothetical protein
MLFLVTTHGPENTRNVCEWGRSARAEARAELSAELSQARIGRILPG